MTQMEVLKSTTNESYISGVELHRQLEVREPYAIWISRVLDPEMENIDFWREWNGGFPKSKSMNPEEG